MEKGEKEILKHLVKKELDRLKKEEVEIEFPPLDYLKSEDIYERELKKMLKTLS